MVAAQVCCYAQRVMSTALKPCSCPKSPLHLELGNACIHSGLLPLLILEVRTVLQVQGTSTDYNDLDASCGPGSDALLPMCMQVRMREPHVRYVRTAGFAVYRCFLLTLGCMTQSRTRGCSGRSVCLLYASMTRVCLHLHIRVQTNA